MVTLCYARFQSGYVAKALRDDGAPLPAAVVCRGIGAFYVVTDSAGQRLSYVYFEDEARRKSAAKLL